MRIMVTGSQGFIGRYLVADWLAADPDAVVVGLGRSPRSDETFTHHVSWRDQKWPAPLPPELVAVAANPRYQYVSVDLTDTPALTRVLADVRPDVVVHLAASLRDEPNDNLVRFNVGAVVSLLESVVGSGIPAPRLVMGSSGSVYGVVEGRTLPLVEDMPCIPVDPYSVSKLAAENMARVLADQHGLDVMWARIFNPVGPGQDERHLCGWLGQQIAAIDAGLAPPEISVGPLHTTRDYIDVRDTASALRAIALRGDAGVVYNVASGEEASGETVLALLSGSTSVDFVHNTVRLPPRKNDMERHFADVARLTALDWRPDTTLEVSLADVVAYYQAHVERTTVAGSDTRSDTPVPPRTAESLTLQPNRSHAYRVDVEVGLLERLPDVLASLRPAGTVAVLTDDRVLDLYGNTLVSGLRDVGFDAHPIIVEQGEEAKSLEVFSEVIEQMHSMKFDRRSLLLNLGGGTVTDLGGYVAASYLRGVSYVNVPTTLLAQHDSAIGGKVAVNAPWAKNFIGAFHHPDAVYADPVVLSTLDVRDIRCGIAESIKVALCGAKGLFELLEERREDILAGDPEVLEEVVRRSSQHKIALLNPDPYEVDLRRALNLGHTFGHSLEVELKYDDLQHGEAVAYGLMVATFIARASGHCGDRDADRILRLVDDYGILPAIAPDRLHAAGRGVGEIRLVRGGVLNYVVPTSIRSVEIFTEVDDATLQSAVDDLVAHQQAVGAA